MIYTSYFAMIRNFPDNVCPVSISRFPPKWYHGKALRVAPSAELLNDIKHGNGSLEERIERYTKEYNKFLEENVTVDRIKAGMMKWFPETSDGLPVWESETDHAALCCFEKPDDFCHRHLLADFLTERGLPIREITKKELLEIKEGENAVER